MRIVLALFFGVVAQGGYVESFNGKLRDECLNRERFDTLLEAQVLIEGWRREYNQIRPHSALGYRPVGVQNHIRSDFGDPAANGRDQRAVVQRMDY